MATHLTTEPGGERGVALHDAVQRQRAKASKQTLFDVCLTFAMVGIVVSPIIFTRSGFSLDFTNSLWLTWVAGKALVAAGHPSYFLNANIPAMGVFYPLLAFEGGSLLVFTGGLGELLGGHPEIAFALVTTLAVMGDYLGALWLARHFRLHGLLAHAPGIAIVSSAYYITDLYGRGDWSEFVAVAALAPLVASAVCLVSSRSWRPGPVLAFVLSVVLFTGSHNLTLLWGSTIGVLGLLVAWLAFGSPRTLPHRRLAMVAGLGVAAVLINAWFLFTDVAYEHFVAAHYLTPPPGVSVWSGSSIFDAPGVLLNPLRSVPAGSTTPALYVQTPVWFLGWGIAVGVLLVSRAAIGPRLRRLWLGALALVLLVLAMLTLSTFWTIVPFPWNEIQFPYRLCAYLFYAVAALVLISGLVLRDATRERPRRAVSGLRAALLGVTTVSVLLCLWQLWLAHTIQPESYTDRGEALASTSVLPRTWYTLEAVFADRHAPVVTVPGERTVLIPPSAVHGERFAAVMELPEGPQPIQTNISGGAYLVHIAGVQRIGRSPYGFAVVRRLPGEERGPVRVIVETAHNGVITAGRVVSVLAIAVVLLVLLWTCISRRVPAARWRTRSPLPTRGLDAD